ncbi:MAG: hypothetical protein V4581_13960 [Bacteroidota bacterium]
MDTALHNLITHKAFEDRQHGLKARFSVNHIDYAYKYNEGAVPSITVWMNHGNIPATITIHEDGRLDYSYFHNGMPRKANFINCTGQDFQEMITFATTYLKDGSNTVTETQWFEKLKKA